MKKYFFITLLGFFPLFLFAQSPLPSGSNGTGGDGSVLLDYDVGYQGVKGTPFLFPDWREGRALLSNGSVIDSVFLKYDLAAQALLLRKGKGPGALTLLMDKVDRVWMKDGARWREWISVPPAAFEKAPREKHLYELVISGEQQFLKKERKRFVEADYRRPFSSGENYDEYASSAVYFLKNKAGKYERIKLRQKPILRALCEPKNRKAVRRYIRDNELWVRDEASAVRLIRYLMKEYGGQ